MERSRTRPSMMRLLSLLAFSLCLAATRPAGATVVLNEVLYDPMGTDDGEERIELYNNGVAAVDVSGMQICVFPAYWPIPNGTIIAAGEFLVIRWNASGANGPHEIFTGPTFVPLAAQGSIGYYIGGTFDFGNPANIRDFVQWGAASQARSDVADAAGIWDQSAFVPAAAEGMSISLDLDGVDNNMASDWVARLPSFGGPNAVSIEAQTWGAIKDLYRTD